MKANLQYERIGAPYGGMSELTLASCHLLKEATGINLLEGFPKHSDWVAEVTGFDAKYKYKREFLHGHVDYAHANSKGTRGIMVNHILEDGRIYQVCQQISWSRLHKYFCTVRDGEIIEISEMEVIRCLRERLASTYTPQPGSE